MYVGSSCPSCSSCSSYILRCSGAHSARSAPKSCRLQPANKRDITNNQRIKNSPRSTRVRYGVISVVFSAFAQTLKFVGLNVEPVFVAIAVAAPGGMLNRYARPSVFVDVCELGKPC